MRNNRSVFRRVQTRIFVASDFRAGKTFDYILLSRGQLCVNCVLAWKTEVNNTQCFITSAFNISCTSNKSNCLQACLK
ncbi:unnamed protein product [Acanthoscelides obtectus]|uniref:Uncharacterized protein n=1 Tax=Acanthoscelides obtectus TaxID=200917 RepID=A0A9P0K0E5_ACAOB|nr:unnamed protein product [Acanthoscelides obtectus]CAH1964846.1 unnamed protein product [Acanthoscelides obtectus]CAK1625268.1 hypothetical protein AOBTE_LOCUS3071 [Acanthoscelides obtectus]CAK1670003.1 hypothetical protein AOBTE_LOCUS27347 [Acanthoscelides obtectus]